MMVDVTSDQTRSDIAHLYRRAGFGARPDELDAAADAGYQATVEGLLAGTGTAPDPTGDRVSPPAFTPYLRPTAAKGTPDAIAAARAKNQANAVELAALEQWWLDRMIATSTPLREKLTLLWHGHFATGYSKVRDPKLMYIQNQLWRTAGAGSFGALVQAMAKDGAMMVWLDTATDKKAHPNENFARELMELFTLGVGNYSQTDVEQGARGFTGWTYDRINYRYRFLPRQHDDGVKNFLGQTGNLAGEEVIDIILAQPESARFVVAKLWGHLAYPVAPSDPVVTGLLASYQPASPLNGLLRAIFFHPQFLSSTARAGLVKQPIEYLVGAARALHLDAHLQRVDPQTGVAAAVAPPAKATAAAAYRTTLVAFATALSQTPFNPPNVGGWPQNSYWLNTATAVARLQVAQLLAAKADLSAIDGLPASQRSDAVAHLLGIDGWGQTTAAALSHVVSEPASLVALALNAPEYILN
ncbi:MAG: DUF1800 domain-containing protein [Actinomycetota bacterium]|nr:DUF1800 domain-containing protein [Actinomycetota bacterium]